MCNPFRAVKKVFKKVVKVAKRVAPAALGIAAIVFTAGAALGIAPFAAMGGWGGAVASMTSQLPGGAMLGQIITGAVTQAGYGAAAGALISGASGGGLLRGAQMGAVTGAATGGLMGAAGMQTDPFHGIGEPSAGPGQGTPLGWDTGPLSGSAPAGPAGGAGAAAGGAGAEAAKTGMAGYVSRNPEMAKVIGGGIQGVGAGAGAYFGAGAEADATRAAAEMALEKERERRAAIAASYAEGGTGLLRSGRGGTASGFPTPAERYDQFLSGFRYEYDSQSGRVIRVPDNTRVA